jgi:hypothetical protein
MVSIGPRGPNIPPRNGDPTPPVVVVHLHLVHPGRTPRSVLDEVLSSWGATCRAALLLVLVLAAIVLVTMTLGLPGQALLGCLGIQARQLRGRRAGE